MDHIELVSLFSKFSLEQRQEMLVALSKEYRSMMSPWENDRIERVTCLIDAIKGAGT